MCKTLSITIDTQLIGCLPSLPSPRPSTKTRNTDVDQKSPFSRRAGRHRRAARRLRRAGDAGSGESAEAGGDVTLTWWHNGNNDPLLSYWQGVADDFEAENEGVTIEVEAIQNEDLRTRLQVALQSNDPPDVLPQWGGGELADQVEAGALMDLTDRIPDTIESLGGSAGGWQSEGATYGVPYCLGVGGFWYNKALFEEAGISEPPATMDELVRRRSRPSRPSTSPRSRSGPPTSGRPPGTTTTPRPGSAPPRPSRPRSWSSTSPTRASSTRASLVQQIVDAEPFNEGFLATPAQTGATSSAGLVGNGLAAMELMGHWNPSVMADLTPDKEGLGDDLGWFPFPEVEGGEGNASAMGGGDGFSCAADAPDVCADFLAFIVNEENQRGFGATGAGLPTLPAATGSVEDPNMQTLLAARDEAEYVQLYLDVTYGPNIGGALNDEVALLFAGQSDPRASSRR